MFMSVCSNAKRGFVIPMLHELFLDGKYFQKHKWLVTVSVSGVDMKYVGNAHKVLGPYFA